MATSRKGIRSRILWTVAFLAAFLLLVNGTVVFLIQTAHRYLDEELGRRLEGAAHTAALLIRPEHLDAILPASPDSLGDDFEKEMDAADAADAVRSEWDVLAEGAGASNVFLIDRGYRVVLSRRESLYADSERVFLDYAAATRAFIGDIAHSQLYEVEGTYLKSAYAPVTRLDGEVAGVVVVEGGSEAFKPLDQIKTPIITAAILASVFGLLIGLGYVRTLGRLARVEESIRHADLLASVGQLAAGVAHEIRNPLAVLRGASDRLQRLERLSAGERAELLTMIDEEVERMSHVVQSFLDLSRRPDTEPQTFDLKPILERSLDILRVELSRSKVDIAFHWETDGGVQIKGRPQAIHHLFLNLALNARDAMPDGGTLTVLVQEHRSEVWVLFQDTGGGVPVGLRAKIFEPFFTTRPQGTGLGLAFVERIVTEHGGSVSVGRAPTGGAQFGIHLPLAST